MAQLKIAKCQVCDKPTPYTVEPILCKKCQAKADVIFNLTNRAAEEALG